MSDDPWKALSDIAKKPWGDTILVYPGNYELAAALAVSVQRTQAAWLDDWCASGFTVTPRMLKRRRRAVRMRRKRKRGWR